MASDGIFRRVVELLLFHSLDRKLHSRLVSKLKQDPKNASRSLALWMWLETIGHDNFISQVSSYADDLLLAIHKESERCFKAIKGGLSPYINFSLPLTSALIKEPLDIGFFLFNRQVVYDGICEITDMIGNVVFDEGLMLLVYRDGYSSISRKLMKIASLIRPTVEWVNVYGPSLSTLLNGKVKFSDPDTETAFLRALEQENRPPESDIHAAKRRSLFISFQRDRPVSEEIIARYFNSRCKNCLEKVALERRPGDERSPAYGRIMFVNARKMMLMMNGKRSASFEIQGRYVWARMHKMPKSWDLSHDDD